jgi:aldose 1-epimerase
MVTIKIDKKQTTVGQVELVTLKNDIIELVLTSYGAAIYQFVVDGNPIHIAPKNLDQFLTDELYYGKTVGRTSGRMLLPGFHLGNQFYPLSANHGNDAKLHGGPKGFPYQHFKIKQMNYNNNEVTCSFMYFSKHMEEEFPGDLEVTVTYTLNRYNEVKIKYEAQSNKDTLCNLTNHIYFNLSRKNEKVYDHEMMVAADHYLEIDENVRIKSKKDVTGSIFDFRTKKNIGEVIHQFKDDPLLGLDHTFILNKNKACVTLSEPSFNYDMICSTTYPAVVIYTHNQPSRKQLEQIKYDGFHSGITLEFLNEPGGIHYPFLNSSILKKNDLYEHEIVFKFEKKVK